MKKILLSVLALGLFLFQSCSKDDAASTRQQQIDNVTSGPWKVTLYSERGNDETSDFTGYTFDFNASGAITATRNGTSTAGTWSISSSKFNINLGAKSDTNKPLGELTDDWQIISVSDKEIKLTDDNASSNEFLTFTKN